MYNITTKQGDKRGWENGKGNGWSHRIERNRAILRLPKGAETYSSPSSSDSLVFFSHVSSSSQNKEPLSSAILTEDKRAKRIPAVAVVIVCARPHAISRWRTLRTMRNSCMEVRFCSILQNVCCIFYHQ